jgi:DNA-binding MarR family transcriptional regulator
MPRPLTSAQQSVLDLVRENPWYTNSDDRGDGWRNRWRWTSDSATQRLLDSLVRKGLVSKTPDERGHVYRVI